MEEKKLAPFVMMPAYRFGESTPWGGSGLETLFHRKIPDERTGESLEISAIPGLESKTPEGITLPDLLKEYGEQITGLSADKPFPLLLKLLNANKQLSVQVHPDDEYAASHEGKLGKTEAWVILHAEPGAYILYGVNSGVTKEQIKQSLEKGYDIEPLIRKIPVKEGDVYYIPSGMVHAIGSGITLYEIQQSSDITYRLWDYNRTNAKGEKRTLHIQQALDTMIPALQGQKSELPEDFDGIIRLLDVPAFRLDAISVNGTLNLPDCSTFRFFTCLAPLTIRWGEQKNQAIFCGNGETVLLPAACYSLTIEGKGRAFLAMP